MSIVNDAKINEEKVSINRAAIEHRALWLGFLFDEIEKAGADAESICRRAVRRCGRFHGELHKANCGGSEDCRVFKEVFLTELGLKTFEMETVQTEKELNVTFHYCPLVSAWKKAGFSDERIAMLCDIAMEGDRGIADKNDMKFELGDTIAKGCATCRIKMSR